MPPLDVYEKQPATNGGTMTLATLKMKGLDWDDVKIAFGGAQPAIVVLKDRTVVEDLYCTLMHALFDDEGAPVTLTIDGNIYTLEAALIS
jgi:hypothetical protein